MIDVLRRHPAWRRRLIAVLDGDDESLAESLARTRGAQARRDDGRMRKVRRGPVAPATGPAR